MKKYVIFDFDGTMARTMDVIVRALNKMAKELNVKEIDSNDIDKFRNEGWKSALKSFKVSPLKFAKITSMVQGEMKNFISDTLLEPGLGVVLEKLRKQGLTLGVLTSNSKENVELFLKKNELEMFEFIYADKSIFGKDRVMKKMFKERKIDVNEAIYIGDEVRDFEACKKVGMDMIGVTWGFNSEKLLREAGLEKTVNEPNELFEKIWD